MASTHTTNLGIEKPTPGEQNGTWGTTLNNDFDLIDRATNGYVEVVLTTAGSSGSPNDLQSAMVGTALQDGQNKFVKFKDNADLAATVYVRLIPPTAERIFIINNELAGNRSIILFQGDWNAAKAYTLTNGKTAIIAFSGEGATQTIGTRGVLTNLVLDGTLTVGGNISAANLSGTNTGDKLTTKGDLLGWSTLLDRMPVGTNDYVLTADSTAAFGFTWKVAQGGSVPVNTRGDIYTHNLTVPARLVVGTNGQFLQADTTAADGTGLKWVTISTGGLGNMVEDTTPELGGNLDGLDWDINLTNSSVVKGINFYEQSSNGASYTRVVAAAAMGATWTMTLPNGPGSNTNILQTNGSGATSWVAMPVSDTGVPAITSNGSTPSLNAGITAPAVRSLIGAGTGDGSVTSVTGGTGIASTGGAAPSLSLTVNELAEKTGAVVGTDRLVGTSGTTNFAETISGIPLSIFNNDLAVTSVTGGLGLALDSSNPRIPDVYVISHAGSAGTIGTLNVGASTLGVDLGSTSTTAAAGNHTHTQLTVSDSASTTAYPLFVTATGGLATVYTDSTGLSYNATTNKLNATEFGATTGTFSGTVTAATFNSTSARDKKTEIGGLIDHWNLDFVTPIRYRMNDDPSNKAQLGFFADDMATAYPEIVTLDDTGKAVGIDYSRLVIPLLLRVRELEARLEAGGL